MPVTIRKIRFESDNCRIEYIGGKDVVICVESQDCLVSALRQCSIFECWSPCVIGGLMQTVYTVGKTVHCYMHD